MITYSTSPGSMPARSRAARIAVAPSSVAGNPASPPPRRPNGVRTADTMTDRDMLFSLQRVKITATVAVAVSDALVLVLDEDYRAVEMSPAFRAGCGLAPGDSALEGLPISRSVFVQFCEHARRTGEAVDLVEFGGGRVLHIRVAPRDERLHTSWQTLGILDTLTMDGLRASLRSIAETLAGTEDTLGRERVRRSLRLVGGGG